MIYWLILVLVIIANLIQKGKTNIYLYPAFYIFLMAAFLKIVSVDTLAEFLMRISFTIFVVELTLSFFAKDIND